MANCAEPFLLKIVASEVEKPVFCIQVPMTAFVLVFAPSSADRKSADPSSQTELPIRVVSKGVGPAVPCPPAPRRRLLLNTITHMPL